MQIHRDIRSLPAFNNAVITVGSFDGVHFAHKIIFEKIKKLSRRLNGESVVITFEPHPRTVVYPKDHTLALLTTIDEKEVLLSSCGMDHLVIAPFTVEFAQLNAQEYIESFLVRLFNPKAVIVGYDHKFGLNRTGNVTLLRNYGRQYGFEVHEIDKQLVDQVTVSSTQIRHAVSNRDVARARRLLGYPYTIFGKVIKGLRIGSTIGYPTANIALEHKTKLLPPPGIYAVEVKVDSKVYQGMMYIGTRPTLSDDGKLTIEINIFDFYEEIYGKRLWVEVLKFIREDEKFDNLDELKERIDLDRKEAIEFFNSSDKLVLERRKYHSAIVILNYNGKAHFEKFLPSVMKHLGSTHKIIVADNGSTDDSINYLQSHFPDVLVIPLEHNFGFAEGYNKALSQIDAQYFVLMNSDVEVIDDWASPLITQMEKDDVIAACQPKVLSHADKSRLEYAGASGGWMDILGYPFCRGRILESTEIDQGKYDESMEVFWATGAAMVVRAELFKSFGRFDPWYFAHQEEIDLCWRFKRAGYKVMAIPAYSVYHVGGGTLSYLNPRKTYLNFRNSLASILKNEPPMKAIVNVLARLFLDGLAGAYFAIKGEFKHTWAIVRAHFNLYVHLPRIFQRRKKQNALIRSLAIASSRVAFGRFKGSIIWQYYLRGIRNFYKLPIRHEETE